MDVEKFYLDVVAEDGRGAIAYAATTRVLGVPLTLGAVLSWPAPGAGRPVHARTLRGRPPRIDAEGVAWDCPALRAHGRWLHPAAPRAPVTLWSDPARGESLEWTCLAAPARAELVLAGERFTGWGYAERLRLDAVPWRLPIERLRWGRFVAADQVVVWIEWSHARPRRWLWHNHAPHAAAWAEGGLRWGDGWTLRPGPDRELRRGRLGETVLADWPGARALLPRRLARFHETKWCSAATLHQGDRTVASGWVIHEEVNFP